MEREIHSLYCHKVGKLWPHAWTEPKEQKIPFVSLLFTHCAVLSSFSGQRVTEAICQVFAVKCYLKARSRPVGQIEFSTEHHTQKPVLLQQPRASETGTNRKTITKDAFPPKRHTLQHPPNVWLWKVGEGKTSQKASESYGIWEIWTKREISSHRI